MAPIKYIKNHIEIFILAGVVVVLLAVNFRMNAFSYNNFDFGKFDLGNMVQMLWNTANGRFMHLTDYFGTNLPRWAMSHFDPILLVFLPIFLLFQHPLTLVFSQIFLVLMSSFLIYAICLIETKSRPVSLLVGLSYLCYPALGFLTSKTGFHGVTAAIPFFLLAFYIMEKMYFSQKITRKSLIIFWVLLVVTLSGKEQIGVYIFLYGLFLLFFRTQPSNVGLFRRNAILVALTGLVWSLIAFFVIIPAYAKYRVEGYEKFARSLGIEGKEVRDVGKENYFLSRYEEFGESYFEVAKGIVLNPNLAIKVFFGGDKIDNFRMTFEPLLYLPFVAPQLLIVAVPDLMMNYLTTAGGIGTAEIQNHRISMVIPVLFISVILSLLFIKNLLKKNKRLSEFAVLALSFWLLCANVFFSFEYQNPVFLWIKEAVQKRLPQFVVSAKTAPELVGGNNLKPGDVVRISQLENKDRECALKIVNTIPDKSSVTGPDYLGAHLAQRETYAIFPALYNEAEYVIVDVFSKKIANILELDVGLISEVINMVMRDPNYKLETSCGNLFVFKKIGPHNKAESLPVQEKYQYTAKFDYAVLFNFTVVDYSLPTELTRGETANLTFVYLKKDKLSSSFLFMSFINSKTGEIYQTANLPSFAVSTLESWKEDYYYTENIEIVLPQYLDEGDYRVFIGLSNYIKTRSIYLGDVQIK